MRTDTIRGLLAGLGAEDIAQRHGHRPADVRAVILSLRASGMLAVIVEQSRDAQRVGATA